MLNIPDDYEPYKLNCTAGDSVVGILCRRPDGGVSDWHTKMNRVAIDGICPISGKAMKEVRTGVYVRKTGDITVVMTNSKASRAHYGRKEAVAHAIPARKKRTVAYKKPSRSPAFPALNKAKPAQAKPLTIEEALKEAGL